MDCSPLSQKVLKQMEIRLVAKCKYSKLHKSLHGTRILACIVNGKTKAHAAPKQCCCFLVRKCAPGLILKYLEAVLRDL